jgi:hypothetical protein
VVSTYLGRCGNEWVVEGDALVSLCQDTDAKIAAVRLVVLPAMFVNVEYHVGTCFQAEGNLFQCLL